MSDTDIIWIPAVPLPFYGLRRVRCSCGETFKGRGREHAYEIHYRRAHQRGDTSENETQMSITRGEARALYAEVDADSVLDGEDVARP